MVISNSSLATQSSTQVAGMITRQQINQYAFAEKAVSNHDL